MQRQKVTLPCNERTTLSKVKELDMFSKVQDVFKIPTAVGGTFSIFSFLAIAVLVYAEVSYLRTSKFVFRYSTHTDFNTKLKINVDLTIAMPCNILGADILDSTGQNTDNFGALKMSGTWFELTPKQRLDFDSKRQFNTYLREEYHAIRDLLWRSSFSTSFGSMPEREVIPQRPQDACRIFGSLVLNKVAGNLHITPGRTLNVPFAHVHINIISEHTTYNFSHRIQRFNFGDPSPGIVHPLEGDEVIADNSNIIYQYFIEVVPTSVATWTTMIDTYQYSVKALTGEINHRNNTHNTPGIYFKYDISALKVTVLQERDHLGMFLAKLCSFIGGIYVCSGLLYKLADWLYEMTGLQRQFVPINAKDQDNTFNMAQFIIVIAFAFFVCIVILTALYLLTEYLNPGHNVFRSS